MKQSSKASTGPTHQPSLPTPAYNDDAFADILQLREGCESSAGVAVPAS